MREGGQTLNPTDTGVPLPDFSAIPGKLER
jgi:hypothetical protein